MDRFFLVFSQPLYLLLHASFLGAFVLPRSMTVAPLTRGVVLGLLVRLGTGFLSSIYEFRYLPSEAIYTHVLVVDVLVPTAAIFGLGLLFGRRWFRNTDREVLVESTCFVTAAFTMFAVADVVTMAGVTSAYPLFLLPVMRLAVAVWVPLLFELARSSHGWFRLLAIVGMAGIPPLVSFAGLLHHLRYGVGAYLLAVVVLGLGAGAYIVANRLVFRLKTS